jgi:hypothetical protein
MGTGTGKEEEEEMRRGEGKKEKGKEGKNKRGRKRKNESVDEGNLKEQNKFFIDVSKEPENKEMLLNLLAQANQKEHGREIILKDLVLIALPKLNLKDIEKIQEGCLSEMEKVDRALLEYNKKNEVQLSLGEFLVKKLGIT